jgi:hypothetical protein
MPMRQSIPSLPAVALGLASVTCAMTPAFTSRRLDDGSYELACKTSLAMCLDRVDEICRGQPFDVLSAHDHRRAIDIQMGNYQNEVRSSEAIVRCTHNKPLLGGDETRPAPPSPPAPSIAPPPARACVPGATQVCVGLGACSGGQACLPDGSGFGPCNCASSAPPPWPGGAPDAGAH